MTPKLKSRARSTGAAGAGFALMAAICLPLNAHAAGETAAPAPAESVAAPASSDTMSNQVVVRDADTGQLRAATPAEANALQKKPATSQALRGGGRLQTLSRAHASGAHGVRLTDEFMSYSVAVRQPDGSVAMQCFGSKEEADAALKAAAASQNNTSPTE